MKKKLKLDLFLWSSLILITSQIFTLYVASREQVFFTENQIISPQMNLGIALAYFFGAVVVLGVILFLTPLAKLKIALRVLFTLLFSWGVFIALVLLMPFKVALPISICVAVVWLFKPRIWLHNLLMIFTLVGVGSVFGFLFAPLTFILFMLVISIYDFLAVRFGYMLWMAERLSESDTLPAFLIPKKISSWNLRLREARLKNLTESESAEREFSILGGGDIGFPLMLVVSIFFAYGLTAAVIVAGFSWCGLIGVYGIQLFFLKGKPMPALPPIFIASLMGFLMVNFM